MRKKIFIIIVVVMFLIGLGYMIVINTITEENENILNEYIPEVEISDEELRKTEVTLYFIDSQDGSIRKECKKIDSKELLRDPYIALLGLLAEGPNDTTLKGIMSKDIKILSATLNKTCVTVNFSADFLNTIPDDLKEIDIILECIVNTLTELKEVNSVKFTIDGKNINELMDTLKEEYTRNE